MKMGYIIKGRWGNHPSEMFTGETSVKIIKRMLKEDYKGFILIKLTRRKPR